MVKILRAAGEAPVSGVAKHSMNDVTILRLAQSLRAARGSGCDAAARACGRERSAQDEVTLKFFDAVVREAHALELLSDEHF
jgi:hypothetical protein